ncbi:ROK family protein [Vibrio sp. JC009]|uniref:ROK family protein n=1 Tax=Vibrio sp. JC009 TaxID=2912314 RepID=UPI0023AF23F6|nr:ROK family protein [Vibrio sp. JC009]WED24931.1 ROK family protein [Vibrio sp. JC009]
MRAGIDIGGTKIEVVVLDDEGKLCFVERIATPTDSYIAFIDALSELVMRADNQVGPLSSIGIGCPGAISPDTNTIKNANCQVLNGHNLAADMAERFALPVKIANDADCLALSEFKDGAAKEAESSCFAAILGTGCGGGIVINGQLVTGVNRIAGEWGHNPLPDWDRVEDGPAHDCYCGRYRCQESFISGTGFARNFYEIYGRRISAKEIIDLAKAGDDQAMAHMSRLYDQLARAFASVINLIDPEIIVLGGGLSNLESIYDEVPKIWGEYIFSDHVHTKLVKAQHGDSSGVRGAAWL